MLDLLLSLRNSKTESLMRESTRKVDPLSGIAVEEKKEKQSKKQLVDSIAKYVTVEVSVYDEEEPQAWFSAHRGRMQLCSKWS